MRRLSIPGLLVLLFSACLCSAQAREPRIVCVDVEAVVARSRLGAEMSEKVRDYVARRNAELQTAEKLLSDEAQALNQKRSLLNESAYLTQRNDLEKKGLELEQRRETVRQEIVEFNRAQLERFTAALAPIVDAIGAERGYTFILNVDSAQPVTLRRSSVLFVASSADITGEVIRRLDAATTVAKKQ